MTVKTVLKPLPRLWLKECFCTMRTINSSRNFDYKRKQLKLLVIQSPLKIWIPKHRQHKCKHKSIAVQIDNQARSCTMGTKRLISLSNIFLKFHVTWLTPFPNFELTKREKHEFNSDCHRKTMRFQFWLE